MARTRASELATRHARAASPSSSTKNQSPLRRSSVALSKTPLSSASVKKESTANSAEDSSSNRADAGLPTAFDDDSTAEVPEVPSALPVDVNGEDDRKPENLNEREKDISPRVEETDDEAQQFDPVLDSLEGTVEVMLPPSVESSAPQELAIDTAPFSENTLTPPNDTSETVDAASEIPSQVHQTKIPLAPIEPQVIDSTQHTHSNNPKSSVSSSQTPSEALYLDPAAISSYSDIAPVPPIVSEKPPESPQDSRQPDNPSIPDRSAEVESLQARLKEVEQRFSGRSFEETFLSLWILIIPTDVSTSFKRLQAEKLAADAILKENTSVEGFSNANSLRDYFVNLRVKDEVSSCLLICSTYVYHDI